MAYRLEELAERTGAELIGEADIPIQGIGSLLNATPGQIAFLSDRRHKKQLKNTRASAIIVGHDDRKSCDLPRLICDDPYLVFASLSQLFWRPPLSVPGIHATAVVAEDCQLDAGVSVGANTVFDIGVKVGKDCVIGANCTIGAGCVLGARCRLAAGVVLEHGVRLGDDVIIHSNVVIGCDGFGFAEDRGRWKKIAQCGSVVIGNQVEIGANTTIDRGAIDDTIIEEGVKIDNQVQVAHNVRIGAHTAIAGCTGIAGSTTIGKYCRIGGAVGIAGHLTICDHVTLAGMAAVSAGIDEPGLYASAPPLEPYRDWLKNKARIKQLDRMAKRLQRLEQTVTKTKDKDRRTDHD